MRIRKLVFVAIATISSSLLLIGTVNAQSKVSKDALKKVEALIVKLEAGCEKEIDKYCSNVTIGGGRLLHCLLAHEDKISDQCYGTLFDIADALDRAAGNVIRAVEVCEADIDKVCANVEPGEGRIAQCLIDKKSELTSTCRAEVAAIEERLK